MYTTERLINDLITASIVIICVVGGFAILIYSADYGFKSHSDYSYIYALAADSQSGRFIPLVQYSEGNGLWTKPYPPNTEFWYDNGAIHFIEAGDPRGVVKPHYKYLTEAEFTQRYAPVWCGDGYPSGDSYDELANREAARLESIYGAPPAETPDDNPMGQEPTIPDND